MHANYDGKTCKILVAFYLTNERYGLFKVHGCIVYKRLITSSVIV